MGEESAGELAGDGVSEEALRRIVKQLGDEMSERIDRDWLKFYLAKQK